MTKRSLAASVAAFAAIAIAGTIAYATIPGPGNVFSACMLNNVGTIRLIDKSLPSTSLMSRCKPGYETEMSWNQMGQPGIQGIPGKDGVNGVDGQDGADGRDGVSVA